MNMMRLENGVQFPTITAARVGGGEMTIPRDVKDKWAIVLFYRGHWCPYCRQQLLDFQQASQQLSEMNTQIVALSVDPLEQAQQTVERQRLSFPVLYGLHANEVVEKIGATMNTDPAYLQATGFVLKPDGTIVVSVYSSSAIGRLVAKDTINLIGYLQKK
jgi:peroxiredoxin